MAGITSVVLPFQRDGEDERMAGEGGEPQPIDRRASAWSDPRTWMTLCGLLLAFLGYVSSQLSSINGGIQALREANATTKEQISNLKDAVTELKSARDTQAQINQQIRDRLSRLEGSGEKKP